MLNEKPPSQGRTSAVSLRPARPSDASLLRFWRTEPSVRRFQPLGDPTLDQVRSELARQRFGDLYRSRGDRFQWVVLEDEQPAGWITLVITNWNHGLCEVGYALSTPFQGRGIMRKALRELVDELFSRTSLQRIEARCSIQNEASYRLLEKVGFLREGLLRGYFLLRGRRHDNYLYAILRSEAPALAERPDDPR